MFCPNTGTKFHEPYHLNHVIPRLGSVYRHPINKSPPQPFYSSIPSPVYLEVDRIYDGVDAETRKSQASFQII